MEEEEFVKPRSFEESHDLLVRGRNEKMTYVLVINNNKFEIDPYKVEKYGLEAVTNILFSLRSVELKKDYVKKDNVVARNYIEKDTHVTLELSPAGSVGVMEEDKYLSYLSIGS